MHVLAIVCGIKFSGSDKILGQFEFARVLDYLHLNSPPCTSLILLVRSTCTFNWIFSTRTVFLFLAIKLNEPIN